MNIKHSLGLLLFSFLLLTSCISHKNVAEASWEKGMRENQIQAEVESLLDTLSLKEKVAQMSGAGGALRGYLKLGWYYGLLHKSRPMISGNHKKLSIPPIVFSDGPRGITYSKATCFPVPIARAASWDRALEYRIGEAMGREARALGINILGNVCVNVLQHPAWGRAQESYGEDPYMLGQMGSSLVLGTQRHNVMACVKHFAANSMENNRFIVNVNMDERTLREVYLPAFKQCVDAGAASIMGAYNKVNGAYACENEFLLTDILRKDWGFKGITTSDWIWGIHDGTKAVLAGMDLEMPFTNAYKKLDKKVENWELNESMIDESVRHILHQKIIFNTLPDPEEYPTSVIACAEHQELALEAAEASIVLLKNRQHILPLDQNKLKSIAVIGSLADAEILGDHGSSRVRPPYSISILQGLQSLTGEKLTVFYTDGKDPEEIRLLAEKADVVLVVVGYGPKDEGENWTNRKAKRKDPHKTMGGDRASLQLHPEDERMIQDAAAANANCIVTLIGGSAIIMENWRAQAKAIVMAWYPGMEGGAAIANILFGEENPSGKLPFTIPKFEGQLPYFDSYTDSVHYGFYHGYTYFQKYEKEATFPFGFGLSYTSFSYQKLQQSAEKISPEDSLFISIEIRNTGEREGAEIVQLYVGADNSLVKRPKMLLKGFEKVQLNKGQTKIIHFTLHPSDLAWYNTAKGKWEIEETEYRIYVGPSSDPLEALTNTFKVKTETKKKE